VDWILIANISVGTPPQTLRVLVDPYDSDLYVIAAGATLNDYSWSWSYSTSDSDSSSASVNTNARPPVSSSSSSSPSSSSEEFAENTYNSSASSTASSNGQNFSAGYGDITGLLVNDLVNVAGLSLNVTLGDVDSYDYVLTWFPIDGILGVSPAPSVNPIPSLLNQLVGQLAEPVITQNTHRDFEAFEDQTDDPSERNELVLGTTANIAGCGSDFSWTAKNSADPDESNTLNVASIAISGNDTAINITRQVYFTNYFELLYVSFEVEALLVQASGAQLDKLDNWYELPCANVSSAKNVVLTEASGLPIVLQPQDYIVEYNGKCYLFAYAFYNEDDDEYADFAISLGQQYLNNHCVAYNIADQSLGISNNVLSA